MNLNSENFHDAISENNLLIVDFWADWCTPCKKLSPILDEISKEYSIPIAKINTDENTEISKQYEIRSIPTMMVFENGIVVKTIVGARPKHVLLREFEQWL